MGFLDFRKWKRAKTAILKFWVKKSKFWLLSPPEAPETPEMDWNIPHWRPLNDLRWVWAFLFWSRTFFCIYMLLNLYIGQLVKIYRGVPSVTSKRLISEGGSFRVITSWVNYSQRDRRTGSSDQNCLVGTKKTDFLAIFGLWGPFWRP